MTANEQLAAIGAAVNRAAAELPIGYEMSIGIERGAAWVEMSDPMYCGVTVDVSSDLSLSERIDAFVDAAVARKVSGR